MDEADAPKSHAQPSTKRLSIIRMLRRLDPGRLSAWDAGFLGAAAVALLGLLYLGRSLTFFHDEWHFIDRRLEWTIEAFMAPHNEHWVVGVALLWKPLLATVGLHSYLPYLVLDLAAHVVTAAAVYWWLRRESGALFGLLAGLLFLFLGTASEVFYQAFALNHVGSTAAGAWALVVFLAFATPRHDLLVAILLLVSIATGGVG